MERLIQGSKDSRCHFPARDCIPPTVLGALSQAQQKGKKIPTTIFRSFHFLSEGHSSLHLTQWLPKSQTAFPGYSKKDPNSVGAETDFPMISEKPRSEMLVLGSGELESAVLLLRAASPRASSIHPKGSAKSQLLCPSQTEPVFVYTSFLVTPRENMGQQKWEG